MRTGGAELGAFQVDAFDGVGGAHHAGIIRAVAQAVGVAQFMEGFLQQAFAKDLRIGRKAIELLAQAMRGNHRPAVRELRFPEHEGEHRDVEVRIRHPQNDRPRIPGGRRMLLSAKSKTRQTS